MTEVNTPAAESALSAEPLRSTPGEYLRKLREEKGHTHAAVSSALHLTVHYIKALESDDYGKLPGLTFVKGYLRSYARFLGADVDSVLARFDEHIANLLDAGQHTARVERSRRRQDQALRWAVGAGFVVVVGLVAGWWLMRDGAPAAEAVQRSAPQQNVAANAATPAAVQSRNTATPVANNANAINRSATPVQAQSSNSVGASPAVVTTTTSANAAAQLSPVDESPETALVAEPADASDSDAEPAALTVRPAANGARQVSLIGEGDDELQVNFSGNSWIEVDDGSMTRLYNDMLTAGDTLTIRGEAPFHILLGDASRVAVSLNAAAVDISGDIRADSTARLVLGGPAGGETSSATAASTGAPR